MKSFLKTTLAVLLALTLFAVVVPVALISLVSLAEDDAPTEIEDKSVLLLQLSGKVVERGTEDEFPMPDFVGFSKPSTIGLNDLLTVLHHAQDDPKLSGIVINLKNMQAGTAVLKELRDALKTFKESSGKFVYAYNNSYSQADYYLSSVADSVFLNPEGDLELKGLNYQVMFFKDALAKVGVQPHVIRHGTFKAAVEPFMLSQMSEANRQQATTFVGALWQMLRADMAASRRLDEQTLQNIADSLLVYTAPTALKHGLVDALIYRDQLIDRLLALTDKKTEDDLKFVSPSAYKKSIERSVEERRRKKIAVVYGQGEIVMGPGADDKIGSDDFAKTIREVRNDSTIKAVVLRINSPGGSALASEIIWRELELTRQVKPIVVSMSDLAASGGYYIACNANHIVAQPATLTGSIGVFGLFFTGKQLLEEKLGIRTDGVKTGQWADFGNLARPLSEFENQRIQQSIEHIYGTFTQHVADGRAMPLDSVLLLGEGRVWSGTDAYRQGLVDELGGIRRALDVAAEKAGLENYRTVEFPKQKTQLERFIESIEKKASARWMQQHLGTDASQALEALEQVRHMEGIQARVPMFIDIE